MKADTMMHLIFYMFFVGVRSLTLNCNGEVARNIKQVDWVKLASLDKTWYDTLRGPPYPRFTDCYNFRNISAVKDGFAVIEELISEGYSDPSIYHGICIQNADGTYTFDRKNVQEFARATKQSISQSMKMNPDIMDQIDGYAAAVHRLRMVMTTDYENYFALLVCSSTGWRPFVKTATKNPTKYDVVKVWNALVDHGILHHIQIMDICIKMTDA